MGMIHSPPFLLDWRWTLFYSQEESFRSYLTTYDHLLSFFTPLREGTVTFGHAGKDVCLFGYGSLKGVFKKGADLVRVDVSRFDKTISEKGACLCLKSSRPAVRGQREGLLVSPLKKASL